MNDSTSWPDPQTMNNRMQLIEQLARPVTYDVAVIGDGVPGFARCFTCVMEALTLTA